MSRRVLTTVAIAVSLVTILGGLAVPAGALNGSATRAHGKLVAKAATPAPRPTSTSVVVAMAADRATGGYWLVTVSGAVFSFGAPFFGSMGGTHLNQPVVGMAATPDGGGYWLVASDGGIFAFGDAGFYGSMGGTPLNQPIVGMAADPSTGGYWEVAQDGGLFAFDAPFQGSMGGTPLNQPVVGMTTAPGGGYDLVASDGGIFAFGGAAFHGSMGGTPLNRPIVGIAVDPSTGGYWEVAQDGGLFAFDAPFLGSMGGQTINRGMVTMAATTGGQGYWLVGADGGLYSFGDADFLGSVDVLPLAGLTVAIDPGHDGGNGSDPQFINQLISNGNSTESCDTSGSSTDAGYPEHAFNFDVATRAEALLVAEGATVVMTRTTDDGVGPCVNVRAAIGNDAQAAAAISIHADGGPPGGLGYTVIEPAPVVGPISNNTAIVAPSAQLGADVDSAFGAATTEPVSTYDGQGGIDVRNDLGGLNLSTVPKVLIECANMRNASDAALIETPQWRQQAAQGITDGITTFLVAEERA
jgi:N-acetylmuramoyl-L-alanine amidase